MEPKYYAEEMIGHPNHHLITTGFLGLVKLQRTHPTDKKATPQKHHYIRFIE